MTLHLFPTLVGLTYPVVREPVWSTDTHRSVSGKRTTLAWYSYPYYRYELQYNFLRATSVTKEWQELLAFFNTVNGRANLFRFNDPDDNSVTANVFGTGDGSTTAFQLLRTITGTSNTWNDPVFHPTAQSILDNGVVVAPANYSVGSTGIVTFNTPPTAGHTLTWTGTFDWLCRFDEDSASFSQFAHLFWENKKVAFSSEKL